MSTDKKLSQLIINKLTQEQFDTITPSNDELYLVEETSSYATVEELATKQDVISDIATIRSNAQAGYDIIPQVNINTQRIEDLTISRFPNVVIIGTPHIEGGQVSNYSDTSYLQFPFVDISRGLPFDIYFSFTTSNDVTTQQNVLDAYFGIALAIKDGKGIMSLSSNGSNWDIGTSVGTNLLQPNTTYYVKYSWTGTQYSASLSTNDETYVPDMNLTSSLSPHKTTIFIGGSPNLFGAGTAHPFKGTINFNKSKVVVNGITVWEGMADVGLASRANVSLNNLDEVGEAKFDTKQDVISDLDTIRQGASDGAEALSGLATEHQERILVDGQLSDAIATKQDIITDLATIRDGASKGATALQSITSSDVTGALGYTPYNATNPNGYTSNTGTITGIKMNGASKGTSGVVDLGTVITSHQSLDSCVKTSGNQTITGVKTFSNAGYNSGGVTINNTDGGASSIVFQNGGVKKGIIGIDGNSKPICEDSGNTITNLVRVTRNTAVGSASQPVYINSSGIATACQKMYLPNILEFKWSDHLINDMSWLRADTFSWQSGTTYKTVYDTLVAEYNNGTEHSNVGGWMPKWRVSPNGYIITTAEYEQNVINRYNTYGIAWIYILDTANKRFKLPRTKWGFKGLRDDVGTDINEKLPNIKGSLNENQRNGFESNPTNAGAIYLDTTKTCFYSNDLQMTMYSGIKFNASRSSSTYQDGAPVQERGTQMYLYFYVGEYARTAIEQTAGLNAEMFNQKQDVCTHIIKTYESGASGYRIWSDGWCVQTGYVNSNKTVSLLKTYKNIDYVITFGSLYGDGVPRAGTRTTGSFDYTSANVANTTAFWCTMGYLADGQY